MKQYTIYSEGQTVKLDADFATMNDNGQTVLSRDAEDGENILNPSELILAVIPKTALIIIDELPKQMRNMIEQ